MTDLSRLFAEPTDRGDHAQETRPSLPAGNIGSSASSIRVTRDASERSLAELVGERPQAEAPRTRDQLVDLVAFVSAPPRDVGGEPVGQMAPVTREAEPKRGRAGFPSRPQISDFLNAGVGILAVVALVAAVVAGVVHRVSMDPAADALVSLGEREAELRNDLQLLTTSVQMYQTAVSTAADAASRGEPALAALRGRVADGPLNDAESARTTLQTVAAAVKPSAVPSYARADIDTHSFAAVAKAIDRVRAVREQVPGLIESTRGSRSQVVAAQEAFRTALVSLATQIKTESSATSAEGPGAASEPLRRAVLDAAQGIPDISPSTGYGLTEMQAYAAAVDRLRAEISRFVGTPDSGTNTTSGGSTRSSTPTIQSPPEEPSPSPSPSPSPDIPTETPAPDPGGPSAEPEATPQVPVG